MVQVSADEVLPTGDLVLPGSTGALVLFAHGSGSSRLSPHNRAVASALQRAGLGTLPMDVLTEQEERVDAVTAEHRFDIVLLSGRLVAAVYWLGQNPRNCRSAGALFGASTGAAAALMAAAERPERVSCVVSRGGRPDLASGALERVQAPVLLIVGGQEHEVLRMNREAAQRLRVRTGSTSWPGRLTCSRNPGCWRRSPALRATGSCNRVSPWKEASPDGLHIAGNGRPNGRYPSECPAADRSGVLRSADGTDR